MVVEMVRMRSSSDTFMKDRHRPKIREKKITWSTVSFTREESTLVGMMLAMISHTLVSAVLPAASAASWVTAARSAWGWKMLPINRPMMTPKAEVIR